VNQKLLVNFMSFLLRKSIDFLFAKKGLVSAFVIAALLFGGGGTTAALAERSYPGDTLYPVKRFVENARIFLAKKPVLRMKLRQLFVKKRLNELKKVLPAGEIKSLSPKQKLLELQKSSS